MATSLEAEDDAYVVGFADELDENGRRLVVRNGHAVASHGEGGGGTGRGVSPAIIRTNPLLNVVQTM